LSAGGKEDGSKMKEWIIKDKRQKAKKRCQKDSFFLHLCVLSVFARKRAEVGSRKPEVRRQKSEDGGENEKGKR